MLLSKLPNGCVAMIVLGLLLLYCSAAARRDQTSWSNDVYWSGVDSSASAINLQAAFFAATHVEKIEFLVSTGTILPALKAGFDLGLFDLLMEPHSLDQVKAKLNLKKRPTEALLTTLVGANFITQQPENGMLSLADNTFFKRRNFVDVWMTLMTREVYHITESARADAPIGLRRVFGEEVHDLYILRSTNPPIAEMWDTFMDYSDAYLVRDTRPLFYSLPDQSLVLDICGNAGFNVIQHARAHPSINFVMADLPGQVVKAQGNFRSANLLKEVGTLPIDLLVDPITFGEDQFDGVYMLHAVSVFDFPRVKKIFQAVHTALRPGGRFLFDTVAGLADGKFRSNYINLLPIYFLVTATPTHVVKHYEDFVAILSEIGFHNLRFLASGDVVLPSNETFYKVDSFAWRQLYIMVEKM